MGRVSNAKPKERPAQRDIYYWGVNNNVLMPEATAQLLFAIVYACKDENIQIPYDAVGKQFAEYLSGPAVEQQLLKLRARLIDKGISLPMNAVKRIDPKLLPKAKVLVPKKAKLGMSESEKAAAKKEEAKNRSKNVATLNDGEPLADAEPGAAHRRDSDPPPRKMTRTWKNARAKLVDDDDDDDMLSAGEDTDPDADYAETVEKQLGHGAGEKRKASIATESTGARKRRATAVSYELPSAGNFEEEDHEARLNAGNKGFKRTARVHADEDEEESDGDPFGPGSEVDDDHADDMSPEHLAGEPVSIKEEVEPKPQRIVVLRVDPAKLLDLHMRSYSTTIPADPNADEIADMVHIDMNATNGPIDPKLQEAAKAEVSDGAVSMPCSQYPPQHGPQPQDLMPHPQTYQPAYQAPLQYPYRQNNPPYPSQADQQQGCVDTNEDAGGSSHRELPSSVLRPDLLDEELNRSTNFFEETLGAYGWDEYLRTDEELEADQVNDATRNDDLHIALWNSMQGFDDDDDYDDDDA